MAKYTVMMEFVGRHTIEFEAENDEQAIKLIGDGEMYQQDGREIHESEECLPIYIENYKGEVLWET
tara:strand:+ start:370 stop:567 length:198 start_codon:yes stop_codon:yes gene_type:complete